MRSLFVSDLMNMGYECSDDFGRRINEVLSLRILELIFDPSKNDGASTSEPRVEFDLSLSNANVLRAILKEVWYGETVNSLTSSRRVRMYGFMIVVFCCQMLVDSSSIRATSRHAGAIKVQCSSVYCSQEHVFATVCA